MLEMCYFAKKSTQIVDYLLESYKTIYDGFTQITLSFFIENEILDWLKSEDFDINILSKNKYVFDMTNILVSQHDYYLFLINETISLAKQFKILLIENQYNYIMNLFEYDPSIHIIQDIYLYEELKEYLIIEKGFSITKIQEDTYYFDDADFCFLPMA